MNSVRILYTMTKRKGRAEYEATTEITIPLDNNHTEAFRDPTARRGVLRENEEFIRLLARLQGYDTGVIKLVEVA